jgi:hypothetical protein
MIVWLVSIDCCGEIVKDPEVFATKPLADKYAEKQQQIYKSFNIEVTEKQVHEA